MLESLEPRRLFAVSISVTSAGTLLIVGTPRGERVEIVHPATNPDFGPNVSIILNNVKVREFPLTDVKRAYFDLGAAKDTAKVSALISATILGGAGNDTIEGGATNNLLVGGRGNDLIEAFDLTGPTTVIAGPGNDTVHLFGKTNDTRAPVTCSAGAGDDVITSNNTTATIFGREGDDDLVTGAGNDTLDGETGNDTLVAGEGDDSLIGGAGDDLLDGADGQDTLLGGPGHDSSRPDPNDVLNDTIEA
jgi:Ca2+-binding RTX toxin-like protein